jgi:hypothetical protein
VTVSCFNRRSVQDKDGEQQTNPAGQGGAPILECANQHAGQMSDMLESGSFEIVLRGGGKTQFVKLSHKKAQNAQD